MVISPAFLFGHFSQVLMLAILALLLKMAIGAPLVRVFGYDWSLSLRCSVGLAHIGEFGFLIASRGRSLGLLERDTYLLLLGTTAMSLLTSPLVLAFVLPDGIQSGNNSPQRERVRLTSEEAGRLTPPELGQLPYSAQNANGNFHSSRSSNSANDSVESSFFFAFSGHESAPSPIELATPSSPRRRNFI
mmetsp:Transcript_19787/g.55884  ORF Transcript_19787/g.55884 Transcript_19787/m.55884 type:complete len:189 (-) Transcript_19787:753-1319(-)